MGIRPKKGAATNCRKGCLISARGCSLTWLDVVGVWEDLPVTEVRRALLTFVSRMEVHGDRIDISLDGSRLERWLNGQDAPIFAGSEDDRDGDAHDGLACTRLTIAAQVKRVGMEMRLVVPGEQGSAPDAGLVRLVVRAHVIREGLIEEKLSIEEVATREGLSPSYVTRLMRLTFLAPNIITGLLSGEHPIELNPAKLMADTRLPLDWSEQRKALGLA